MEYTSILFIGSNKLINFTDFFFKRDNILKLVGTAAIANYCITTLGYDKKYLLYLLKKIPYIKNEINEKKQKIRQEIKDDLNEPIKNLKINYKIPQNGLEENKVLEEITSYSKLLGYDSNQGKISGCVYSNSKKIDRLMAQVFPLFERTNPLHPDIYPGVRKMEAEIVNMCGNLMKSVYPQAGCFTSGGTESIILAMRSYKMIAKERGIKGDILLAKSAHAAYWKAAEYFDMNTIEIDTVEEPLDDIFIENHITRDTIVIIASAPSFNFGIVDDIKNISDFCFKNHIYLHVDLCLGGFLLPFLDNMEVDFTQLGISSISMDTHKYGYGPKGGSVLLYRDPYLVKKHCFIKEDWTGGIYGTSNLTGSRSGAVIALTWSTMMSIGISGYTEEANRIQKMVIALRNDINKNNNLFVYGNPKICIVGIGTIDFNIYLLTDKLKDKGWSLNILQNPPGFHFCITSVHTMDNIKQLIYDINYSTKDIMENEDKLTIQPVSIYGTTQKVKDGDIISDVVREYISCLNELK